MKRKILQTHDSASVTTECGAALTDWANCRRDKYEKLARFCAMP